MEQIQGLGVFGLIIGIFILMVILLYYVPVGLWFSALVSDVRISLIQPLPDAVSESTTISYRSCHD